MNTTTNPTRPRRKALVGLVATLAFAFAFLATAPSPASARLSSQVNSYSCTPSAQHPRPVILLHATFSTMNEWSEMSEVLLDEGYCTFALNYGCANRWMCGVDPMEDSAGELSVFVDGVLAATGAAEVDLVGHSQGGLMPRYYLKFLGGASKVHDLVGISAPNHGTDNASKKSCGACPQGQTGSDWLLNLNAGGDTVPGVEYTNIATKYDPQVKPYTSSFLTGPSVTNITLQDTCPTDKVLHLKIQKDPNTIGWTLRALDPTVAPPACVPFK